MEVINQFLSLESQAVLFQALVGAGLALPFLEWVANKTTNKIDNKIVKVLRNLLALVPRVGVGKKL